MLRRAREAGFHTLILTVDVPAASRRERQTRGGLTSRRA
jgi:L-lactate dehydrogenase (cytochrome)